jgi:hypothetical protein
MKDLSILIRGNVLVTIPNDLSLLTPYILAEQRDWFEAEILLSACWLRPA